MSRHIDYYFSLQSPWAYIGHAMFSDLARRHGARVSYKPVVLVDLFADTGGLPLKQRHPVRQRYRMLELQRWRARRGLDFHLQPKHWPFDGRLADGMVIAVAASGADPDAFLRKAYAAVWEEERNLADATTLAALADEAGLPGAELVKRAASDDIAAIYRQNRQDALDADVFGSPAYVLDGEVFWGQDRIELLDDALSSGRAAFRSAP